MHSFGQAAETELCAAVTALAGEEITTSEFRDAVAPLSPESIQIAATVLGCFAVMLPEPSERLRIGRAICSSAAARRRHLN
jgi:hypothetical protein